MRELPYFKKENDVFTLIVDGKPFLALGGEIHNSAASDPVFMEKEVWPALKKLGGNFCLMPVYWEKIEEKPMNIALREEVGRVLRPDEISRAAEAAEELLSEPEKYRDAISRCLSETVFYPGESARIEADYIVSAIQRKIRERKEASSK